MMPPSGADPLATRINAITGRMVNARSRPKLGWVREIRGAVLYAALENAPIGGICAIKGNDASTLAEIIGATGSTAVLSPFSGVTGLSASATVTLTDSTFRVPVGDGLLGRVVNGLGQPIDNLGPLQDTILQPARVAAPDPVGRPLIDTQLLTGIRALDAFTAIGRGQRLGIFGPPGVGKSGLLSALACNCDADVVVIGLVGERGREIREFIDRSLPFEKRSQTIVVASTSDRPPLERVYAAHTATAIAEEMRDRGKSVLLLIDSLTRVARALREIGLAAGEPPTRRGYPASVYAALPELIERSGRTTKGDITALYTVLVEGTGEGDPIAEEVRSLTDGHIILNPDIAERGRYPAVDALASLSRLMTEVAASGDIERARKARALLAKYQEIELLLQVGEYAPGSDETADHAIRAYDQIEAFMSQRLDEDPSLLPTTRRRFAEALR